MLRASDGHEPGSKPGPGRAEPKPLRPSPLASGSGSMVGCLKPGLEADGFPKEEVPRFYTYNYVSRTDSIV